MIIEYNFEQVPVSYYQGEEVRWEDIDYEYDASVTEEDIIDYLLVRGQSEDFNRGVRHAILSLADSVDIYNLIDLLEEMDEYFVNFIKEKYESKAYEECKRAFL